MQSPQALLVASISGLLLAASAQADPFVINTATDLFAPSFRDGTDSDLGGTTFFGWGAGSFDGAPNDELIDSPTPTLGVGGLDGTLGQLGTADILSGANNIYNGTDGRTETLRLTVPTSGTVGLDGFTTIIIQGLTSVGSPAANAIVNYPTFPAINGVNPEFVIGLDANVSGTNGQGQWWAKYELPGNQASYIVDITVTNAGGFAVPLTLEKLTIDTQFSETGYAVDTAVVPEPATTGLFGVAVLGLLGRRRRA